MRNRYFPIRDIAKMPEKRAWKLYFRLAWKIKIVLDKMDYLELLGLKGTIKYNRLDNKLQDMYIVDYYFRSLGYCG